MLVRLHAAYNQWRTAHAAAVADRANMSMAVSYDRRVVTKRVMDAWLGRTQLTIHKQVRWSFITSIWPLNYQYFSMANISKVLVMTLDAF